MESLARLRASPSSLRPLAFATPISPQNGMAGMRFPAGGDYHGLVALPDGSFRMVWSDARSGVFELWTNTVRIER